MDREEIEEPYGELQLLVWNLRALLHMDGKMNNDKLLSIQGLRTYFYTGAGVVKAVDGVDLCIGPGETLGVVGESGCGKSVTALSILQLIPQPPGKVVEGEIWFQDRNLLELSQDDMRLVRGRAISMIFQEPMTSLNPVLRIGQQMLEVLQLHQEISAEQARRRAIEMLDLVRIPDAASVLNKYPHALSGGMRQRVMIAMALSCYPALLIADEPTTALDVTVQAQILALMSQLQERTNAAIMMITHNLGVVAETCDRICVMYAGHVVEQASSDDLFETPLHPYTQGLLGSIPLLHEEKEELATIPGIVPSLIHPPSGCRFHNRCSHAMDICSQRKPPLSMTEPRHEVACFLYDDAESQGEQE
jgi:peptide/nickel transport system ATP-binding protein